MLARQGSIWRELGKLRHQLLLRMPDTHLQLRLVRRLGSVS
jgi:hypothetical protein